MLIQNAAYRYARSSKSLAISSKSSSLPGVIHKTPIPAYSLFGQKAGLVEPRFFHVERIGDRWALHGGEVEEHSHPHLHQMTLWISGSGEYIADDTVSSIRAMTLCWMPAGVVHGFRVSSGSEAIVLSLSDDFAREQLASLSKEINLSPFHDFVVECADGEDAAWLRMLFHQMEREYKSAPQGNTQCVGALARLALAELHRLRQSRNEVIPGLTYAEPSLLVRFMALLERKLNERPSIADLANELGTTPYLLNQACSTGLNLRASEVVRQRRMQEAKRLLLFTALSIGEIGELVGYPDPAHFARSFRNLTGMSPGAWRESRTDRRSIGGRIDQGLGAASEEPDIGTKRDECHTLSDAGPRVFE